MSRTLTDGMFKNPPTGTSTADRFVLLVLASHASDNGGSCYPGIASIAAIVGCDERTVRRSLEHLAALNLIAIVRGKRHHTYQILWRPSEKTAVPTVDRVSAVDAGKVDPLPAIIPDPVSTVDRVPTRKWTDDPLNTGQTIHRSSQLIQSVDPERDHSPTAPTNLSEIGVHPSKKRSWSVPFFEIEHRYPDNDELSTVDGAMRGAKTAGTEDEWRRAFAKARERRADYWLAYAATIVRSTKLSALPPESARHSKLEDENEARTQAALRNDAATRTHIGYERVPQQKPIIPTPGLLERVALRRTGT